MCKVGVVQRVHLNSTRGPRMILTPYNKIARGQLLQTTLVDSLVPNIQDCAYDSATPETRTEERDTSNSAAKLLLSRPWRRKQYTLS